MRSSCPAGSRRAAAPSLHPIALAVAVFTFSPAWAQTGTAAPQTAEQASSDAVQEPKSLDHITISGARESASTRLPLTPRENPQSTNTVDRAQMERQSLTSIDAVLRNVTGIAVSFYDTQRPLYYARGFQITDFKVDGLPTYSGGTNQEYDTALYERIDVVRGANGILTAIGVPSATVDMIRKRPQREFAASVALTAGSWNLWRGELDLNAPLTSDGSVRSRLVVAPQTKESFRDRYQEDKTALLAAIEADLGNATVATVGFQRQRNVPEAPIWGTIPRFAADGGLANLPVSTSFSPSWTRWERTSSTLYANVDHQINEDWSAKVSLNHTEGDSFRLATYGSGYLNRSTGAGLTLRAAVSGGTETQDTLDAYLSGKVQLGGRKHDLVVGVSASRVETHTDSYSSVAGWTYNIPNLYTWDGSAPAPTYRATGAFSEQITRQTGLYASARWRLSDPLSLLTGARITDWHRQTDAYNTSGAYTGTSAIQDENRKITPFLGVVYELTPTLSAYASHSRIFNPQNYKDVNNQPLSAVVGSNTEAGLKAELLERRVQANLALFQTKQNNYGVRDSSAPEASLPDGTSAYKTVNGTRSHGFEIEVSGLINRQWRAKAGFTRTMVTRAATDLIYANLPEYQLQLGSDYQFTGALAPLSVGGDVQWQSKIVGYNIPHPTLGTVTVTESPMALVNLRATWKFNPKLSATLAINNLSSKKYWANLDYPNYGDPRNVSVTLRAKF